MGGWHEDFEDEQESHLWEAEQYAWDNRDESDPDDPFYDPYWGEEDMADVDWDDHYNDERDWL